MSDDMSVLVQRIVTDGVESDQLPFFADLWSATVLLRPSDSADDRFEQTVAVLRDVSSDLTPEQVVDMAYDEANMRSRSGQHAVTHFTESVESVEDKQRTCGELLQLGDSVEIEREA